VFPDARLRRVLLLAVAGILTAQSPCVTRRASPTSRRRVRQVSAAKRIYRLLSNPRLSARRLAHGLYPVAWATVAAEARTYLVVALDPVQLAKPYTHQLLGVCTVHKSTPPDHRSKARLARDYLALTATIVHTRVPATYARWFSYKTDFISQNHELRHAMRMTRHLLPCIRLRFVADSGLDALELFGYLNDVQGEWIIRASHLARWVEVYNVRADRWEQEHLQDLGDTVP
jgi:hypothetical protein